MRKLILLTVMLVLLSELLMAQQPASQPSTKPPDQQSAPQPSTTKIPDIPFTKQIRKTVAFVETDCVSKDGSAGTFGGTAFFVSHADPRLGSDQAFVYLVTNRHIAECWDEENTPRTVLRLRIRLNLLEGSSNTSEVQGNLPWVFPTDDSVDLAIYPVAPDRSKFDYKTIQDSLLATDDIITREGIAEGQKITLSGFFVQFPGKKKIQPIIREGILAMMPDEDIDALKNRKPARFFLGDVHIFGGNSGSPVFIETGGLEGNGIRFGGTWLLGVVSGLFFEDEHFGLQVSTTYKGTMHGNSGIATIIPAQFLKNLIDDPRVQALRDAEVVRQKKATPPAK